MIPVLTALFWAVSFFTPYSLAGGGLTTEGLKKSLSMNESLLTKSTLVRKVEEIDLPEVSETLEKARSFHKKALDKLSKSDLKGAAKARDESLRLLMLASRLAHKASSFVEENAKVSYEEKLKSVQALLAAHKRITDLSSDSETEKMLQKKVMPLLAESEIEAKQKKYEEAFSLLSKAYVLTTSSINTQRSGQTLVRSLDFATEREAYEYEFGRYENYKMLVNMMIDDRKLFKRDARTKPFFDETERYQRQAEQFAKQGQYMKASEAIEKASKTLVSLLRDSGIHIPGV